MCTTFCLMPTFICTHYGSGAWSTGGLLLFTTPVVDRLCKAERGNRVSNSITPLIVARACVWLRRYDSICGAK